MGTQFWRGDGPTLQKPKGGSPAVEERGAEVDYQVAAPAEMRTPNLHRAKIAHKRVRMEGWRQRRLGSKTRNSQGGRRKTDLTLTGLLMEGLSQFGGARREGPSPGSW